MQAAEQRPMACTLERGSIGPRVAWIRGLAERSLLSHRLDGRTLRLVYRADAEEELRRIVALEQTCCVFLDFALKPTTAEMVMTITAPVGSESDVQWLFAQFLPEGRAAPSACGCKGGCG